MSAVDKSAASAILREMIADDPHTVASYKGNPCAALAKKVRFTGDKYKWEVEHGDGDNTSFDDADALMKLNTLEQAQFQVSTVESFNAKDVSHRALREVRDEGAFVDVLKDILESMNRAGGKTLETGLFQDRGNAKGQVDSSGGGALFITLKNPTDIAKFYQNLRVRASTADGNSGSLLPGTVQVVGVDVDTGRVYTAGANWNVQITGLVADCFLFQAASFGRGRDGLRGWIPDSAPGSTPFNNVDRSVNITALGGHRRSVAAGTDVASVLRTACTQIKNGGGMADTVLLSEFLLAEFAEQQDQKVQFQELKGDKVTVGVPTMVFVAGSMKLNLVGTWGCSDERLYVGARDDLEIVHSTTGVVEIVDEDGATLSRNASKFTYDLRSIQIYNYIVRNPTNWQVTKFAA
jgi:hypothetical protein